MSKEIEDALDEDDAVDMSKDMKAALEAEQDEQDQESNVGQTIGNVTHVDAPM